MAQSKAGTHLRQTTKVVSRDNPWSKEDCVSQVSADQDSPDNNNMKQPAKSWTAAELGTMLSRTIGQEAALAAVQKVISKLGYNGSSLTSDQSLRVLDSLSKDGGLIGITAVFAKTRIHLSE